MELASHLRIAPRKYWVFSCLRGCTDAAQSCFCSPRLIRTSILGALVHTGLSTLGVVDLWFNIGSIQLVFVGVCVDTNELLIILWLDAN